MSTNIIEHDGLHMLVHWFVCVFGEETISRRLFFFLKEDNIAEDRSSSNIASVHALE
jgi:hypothetical protein